MFTIGCHLSSAKGYLNMAESAVSIDANTFQFFTRNPRGGKAKAIDPKDVAAYAAYAGEHGIVRILAHAPYTLNPASDKQQTQDFARMVLAEDLVRMEETPGQLYNMHPGSAVGQPVEVAVNKIADALNQSLLPHQTTTLLLEWRARVAKSAVRSRSWLPLSRRSSCKTMWAYAWTPATCGMRGTTLPTTWTGFWRSSIGSSGSIACAPSI